ncbi:holin [Brevibacillus laterosporus]|nr:phage holin family protein [Brevibacillus laterosporus]TPG90712.1 holin [Brevibacillus laterosporus]
MMYSGEDSSHLMWTGAVIAIITYLVGGIDKLFTAFCIFMLVDYITGVLAAWYNRSLSSQEGFRGIAKKVGMFAFIIIANQLDLISGSSQGFLRDTIILFMIGNEGISILENCHRLGLPVPDFLLRALQNVKKFKKDDNWK